LGDAEKPSNLDEYKAWLRTEHGIDNLEQLPTHYGNASDQMRRAFAGLPFWTGLKQGRLRDFEEEYQLVHRGYPLLLQPDLPDLQTKSYESLIGKTFRINVLRNRNWPGEPMLRGKKAWILPRHWFNTINDLVRTCFVVKYFDGVKFLASQLAEECEQVGLRCSTVLEARDEGHYAAHLYVSYDCEITSLSWQPEIISTTAELQITTQVQDVIRTMLHRLYERSREQPVPAGDWKWDHSSSEFATNYLGHILHYLEGMIVEVRDKEQEQP
jgi:hypothetical protein